MRHGGTTSPQFNSLLLGSSFAENFILAPCARQQLVYTRGTLLPLIIPPCFGVLLPAHKVVQVVFSTNVSGKPSPSKIKNGWEGKLMVELSDRHWEDALQRMNSSSSCARLGLIQFKVVHRAHFSKARLADTYPGADRNCNRCSLSPADLTHTFWLCPRLNQYWSSVFQTLSEVIKIQIKLCLLIAIFGTPKETNRTLLLLYHFFTVVESYQFGHLLLHQRWPNG